MDFRSRYSASAATAMMCLATHVAAAPGTPAAPGRSVPLFTIAKSQNRNQVQYAVHVNDECVPTPGTPVFAYWRMLERGPSNFAPILPREVSAYGVASQVVTSHDVDGGKVRVELHALPKRPITVETWRGSDGTCKAFAALTVSGQPAHLFNVYVKLKWLLGVDYLVLRGWAKDGTHVLREKLDD